jgi:uncharacterized protein (DUF4415 family)
MRKASTTIKSVKISERTRQRYRDRDRRLDHAEVPQLPPAQWAKGTVGKYYRPIKSQISFRIDKDVLDWLKSKGAGHLSRINAILREQMESATLNEVGRSPQAAGRTAGKKSHRLG